MRSSAIEQPISGKVGTIIGSAEVTSKSEATITSVTFRFIVEETKGKGEEKETESETIAEETAKDEIVVAAGGIHQIAINLDYDTTGLADKLASKGGVMGAVGKMGKLAGKLGAGVKDYFDGEEKGTFYLFYAFLGRPRGRNEESRPSFFAACCCQS